MLYKLHANVVALTHLYCVDVYMYVQNVVNQLYGIIVLWPLQRREVEYDKFLHDKMIRAKEEFRALLRETKIITHR